MRSRKSDLIRRSRLTGLDFEEEVEVAPSDVIVHTRAEHAHGRLRAKDGARRVADRSDLVRLEAHWVVLRRRHVEVKSP
jgi:hypothetical protein